MNVFLVLAHPEPMSFNGALFDVARQTFAACGDTVQTSDLYAIDFEARSGANNFAGLRDPSYLRLQQEELYAAETGGFAHDLDGEIRKIEAADLVVFQFPLWWFGLPAILKGWVDRVFAMGRLYGGGRRYETGMLRGKRALLSLTTGGPRETYISGGVNGDIMAILRPIHRGMLKFVGFDVLTPAIYYGPSRVDDAQRRQWLTAHAERLKSIHLEEPIHVGDFA